ncbi:AAA family ATPase [Pseudonocardia endophytica]|uniref:Putative ATPase n=1 Tax=Pseudonocardia endophytica TaxID=401976 RepID=A0A4V2PIE6_PSEEN|nr:AAA family ATPase [Pseudonocardia endophytica]TCK24346.1 putative ATPase [Pseudonocardia endophytica]
MPRALTLLDDVRWNGEPVVGDRPGALLEALVEAGPAGRSAESLIEAVWGDDPPANPTKALQVLVSRVRATTDARVIERTARGYRLGLGRDEVDVLAHADLVEAARSAYEDGRLDAAVAAARDALTLAPSDVAARVLAMGLGRAGQHAEALPLLEERAHDDAVLAQLLRSEAAVRGPAVALERYERHRTELAERLGSDPGPLLQDVHRELLAADRPVHDGVRFDAAPLLGRDADVRALRSLLGGNRVVSILGAGGLGKTRLAHVMGRETDLPVVRFVELAGVGAAEDVVGEVASAIGVRDSVIEQRTLTREQRADVRARIARHLAGAPTLLILDNCEHVVDAVAELVAFLVAGVRDLRVLTTTRAPLAIAAERVYPLAQLGRSDGVALFRQRAEAARPSVVLDDDVVADVVTHLDGLPLAIELAAARVRVMSVEDVRSRLDDRFVLLRGGDRSAPDRHRTLLAVIEWSWNLLDAPTRRALTWLSVFHDGFTGGAATEMLGPDAWDLLGELVEQSLLTVVEAGGVRYRMLETVREFGRMRLDAAGERDDAERAQRSWARRLAVEQFDELDGPGQYAAMDVLRAEEANLADVLRRALAEPEPATGLALLAALATYWSIIGDHTRVLGLADAVECAVEGWTPPSELTEQVGAGLAMLLLNARMMSLKGLPHSRALLARIGPDVRGPSATAWFELVAATEDGLHGSPDALRRLGERPEPRVAGTALQFLAHTLENDGDLAGAIPAAVRALELTRDDEGPWTRASRHSMLAEMYAQLGEHALAARHAREAIPVLDRLDATDDAIQCRTTVALDLLVRGDLTGVQRMLDEAEQVRRGRSGLRSRVSWELVAAELALAGGERATGLERYRGAIEKMRRLAVPDVAIDMASFAPWVLIGDALGVAVFAVHGVGDEGTEYWEQLRAKAPDAFDLARPHLDYPVLGTLLFGIGLWGLRRDALPVEPAVRLVVLADRFSYSRSAPTLAWANAADTAERLAPGLIARVQAEYGERRGPDLLAGARAVLVNLS